MSAIPLNWRSALSTGTLLGVLLLLTLLAVQPAAATAGHSDGNVTAYRAVGIEFESAESVASAIETRTVVRPEELIINDILIVVIRSERLAADMAAANGSMTDRFFAAVDGNATFRLVQTNPSPQRTPLVGELGPANVTVYRNGSTAYALVDTGAVTFHHQGTTDPSEIFGDERFVAQFHYNVTDPSMNKATTSQEFGLHPLKSRLYSKGYTYEPLPPEWVRASVEVQIPPSHSLKVRLMFGGNRTRTFPVERLDEPGFKHVWFDLRGIETGTEYSLQLMHDGVVTDQYSGVVREPRAVIRNVTLTEVTTSRRVTRDGERVTERIHDHAAVNATVNLSHGGKVEVLDDSCEPVGFAWVDPGEETQVSMDLWRDGTPIRDLNESDFGFMVRALRNKGATRPIYQGNVTFAARNFETSCPVSSRTQPPRETGSPTPTTSGSTATTTLPTTEPAPDPVETTSIPDTVQPATSSPGQPGFTFLSALCVVFGLLLLRGV